MNLKKTTLRRPVNNYKKSLNDGKKDVSCIPRYKTKQIFTAKRELSLKSYLITSAKIHFDLSPLNVFLYVFLQLQCNFNVVKRSLFFCQNEKVQIIQRLPCITMLNK